MVKSRFEKLVAVLGYQLKLNYVSDNGVWSNKFGSYAVDGIYHGPESIELNDAHYYHSDGTQKPMLLLSLESTSEVKAVRSLLRKNAGTAGNQKTRFQVFAVKAFLELNRL